MDSNDKLLCANDKIISRNKKIYSKDNNIVNTFDKTESRIKYFNNLDVINVNPFLKNIINFSAINLKTFKKKLNVYYPYSSNLKLNEITKFFFSHQYTITNWDKVYKKNHLSALKLVCDFLNVEVSEVKNYEEADIVVSTFAEKTNFIGVSTYPFEIDIYPILDKKFFIFYSQIPLDENTSRGTFWFFAFMHHILHCFGLYHQCCEISSSCNSPGIFYMDSIYATIMQERTTFENYPQNLMPLDIEALKFLYKVKDTSRYRKWMDTGCSRGVVQTLIGDIVLELKPDRISKTFNLTLDPININPGPDFMTNLSVISKIANDKNSFNIVNGDAYVKEVMNYFEELNVYCSKITKDTKIITAGCNVKRINIFIQGNEKEFVVMDEKVKVTIIRKTTLTKILVDTNDYNDIEIEVFFLGSKLFDKFPEKIKFHFDEEVKHKKEKTEEEVKINLECYEDIKVEAPEPVLELVVAEKSLESGVVPENKPLVPSTEDDVGATIISNLQEEHYNEIINNFFNKFPDLSAKIEDEKVIDLLNVYGINYIAKKFKSKLKGRKFPMMAEMLEKKKSEFKNTSIVSDITQ